MIFLFLINTVFAFNSGPMAQNFKCDGDMNVSYAKPIPGQTCIEVPIENGKHKDLTDYKISKGSFVLDVEKIQAKEAEAADNERAEGLKKAEKDSINAMSKKQNISNADRDEMLKFIIKELIKEE